MSPIAPTPSRAAAAAALTVLLVAALPAAAQTAAATSPPATVRGLPDFTDLVERVGPSVVNIRTLERGGGRSMPGMPRGLDPGLEEFLRRFGIPLPGGRGGPNTPNTPNVPRGGGGGGGDDEPVQRGVGSGFVLSADGFIMTNAHVVDGADEVFVTLTDKREFKARVVGLDKRTDVAVVRIEATGLSPVRFGDVGRLKVGEWVLAIGSPFNLDNSVTAGIVSAKARDTGEYLPFIQTDVAVNPGNSGGPLINMRGEVVGVNSQIYSRSGGYMGISFAIPIDEAARVAEQLRANGRVVRGRIGVTIGPVSKEVAEAIGLGRAQGAVVQATESGGPADKAGLEPGDVILRVDGRAVERSTDLPRLIGATAPGSRAKLDVFRRGASREFVVSVAEFEPDAPPAARRASSAPSAPAVPAALGLTVADLTDVQRRELKIRSGGVRVEAAAGAAARAGLQEGDVILSVDSAEVADAKQFQTLAIRAERAKTVTLLVRRGATAQFVVLRTGA